MKLSVALKKSGRKVVCTSILLGYTCNVYYNSKIGDEKSDIRLW